MKKLFSFIVYVCLLPGLQGCNSDPGYPDVSLARFQLFNGKQVSMSELAGSPVIVTFWATTCAACIREIPDVIKLHNNYSSQGLKIIGVAMPYDRPDHVIEFVSSRKLPYFISLDIKAEIVRTFGNIRITPNNFLINPDGRIYDHQVGILDMNKTVKWLKASLH